MRIVCISDTHGFHDRLVIPDGDLLMSGPVLRNLFFFICLRLCIFTLPR